MRTADLAELRALVTRLASDQRVEPASVPPQGWMIDADGVLRHERVPFFDLVGIRSEGADARVIMRQPEQALVGLLVTRIDGALHALLTARCEPGLHGGCQLSATVQSTPTNYLRRHGGAATPHIELLLEPGDGRTVLHDSVQYDWAQHYWGKTKRILAVELPAPIEPQGEAIWVAEGVLRELLTQDFAITADLRTVLAAVLPAPARASAVAAAAVLDQERRRDVPVPAAAPCRLDEVPGWSTDAPVSVRAVQVSSPSREVTAWQQPLLEIRDHQHVLLPVRGELDEPEALRFAVQCRTAVGLDGRQLWFPADHAADPRRSLARVVTSAEGGRFWLHEVTLELCSALAEVDDPSVRWLSLAELDALCRADAATALELRLALSVALAVTMSAGVAP